MIYVTFIEGSRVRAHVVHNISFVLERERKGEGNEK